MNVVLYATRGDRTAWLLRIPATTFGTLTREIIHDVGYENIHTNVRVSNGFPSSQFPAIMCTYSRAELSRRPSLLWLLVSRSRYLGWWWWRSSCNYLGHEHADTTSRVSSPSANMNANPYKHSRYVHELQKSAHVNPGKLYEYSSLTGRIENR